MKNKVKIRPEAPQGKRCMEITNGTFMKKIQNNIIEFKFMTQFEDIMGQVLDNDKTFLKASNAVLELCRQKLYLKDGTFYKKK